MEGKGGRRREREGKEGGKWIAIERVEEDWK